MLQRKAGRGDVVEVQAGWESGCFSPGAGRGATAGVCTRLSLCIFLPGGFRAGRRGERRCWPVRLELVGKACPGGRPESSLLDLRGASSRQVGGPSLAWTVGGSRLQCAWYVWLPFPPENGGALELLGPWRDRDQHPGWTGGTPGAETQAGWPVAAVRTGTQATAGAGVCPQVGAAGRTGSLETVLFART